MGRPSIAIVVLDTLRRDIFSRYFEWVPGMFFENAYSTSHWTIPAHASILTGKYASEVGVHGKSRSFDCPEKSIAEALQGAGYSTRMWTANMQMYTWEGWGRGFDEVLGRNELHPTADGSIDWSQIDWDNDLPTPMKYIPAIRYAVVSPRRAIPSLRHGFHLFHKRAADGGAQSVFKRLKQTRFKEEEFLLINLMDMHTPHYPPNPFRSIDQEVNFLIGDAFADMIDDPDQNRRAYDDSAAFLSAMYKKIFRLLMEYFDYVITLSDHGELLGEHGLWNHGYGLYHELAHVPLMITGDRADHGVRKDTASLLDIPQTVANIATVEFECRGKDLMSNEESLDRLVEYHGFLPWHRSQFDRKGVSEMYDRLDSPLYGMVTNEWRYVHQTHQEYNKHQVNCINQKEETQMNRLVSDLSKRTVEPESEKISPHVKKQLEKLGYA